MDKDLKLAVEQVQKANPDWSPATIEWIVCGAPQKRSMRLTDMDSSYAGPKPGYHAAYKGNVTCR